ncbi:MAG TPA: hypothetical protein VFQ28_07065 [Gaiella sp.]|nr:hypothetical protein [Gaiella sp.]
MDPGRLSFEDPWAALVGLVALLPLAASLLAGRRSRRLALALGLEPGRAWRPLPTVAAVGACLALAVAAARPVLEQGERQVRADAEVVFVVDVSRSMLASASPTAARRLDRAREIARRLRDVVPDVPAGVSGLTDRVLPYSFPSPDRAFFAEVVARSVEVESPPPRIAGGSVVATSYEPLRELVGGFFTNGIGHRACVVVTDGESRSSETGPDGSECTFLVVRVGSAGERVFGAGGRPEAGYVPDPTATATLERLAAETGGRVWPASRLDDVAAALRNAVETGLTRPVPEPGAVRSLAPYPAALGVALTGLLALGSLRRRRIRSSQIVSSAQPAPR